MIRLLANDQLLNALLSNAHTVLQLSICEGFKVKVSEALHKTRPIIATRTPGIPPQAQDGKNGFLVEPGDWEAVGRKLLRLRTDVELYERMSGFAGRSVSDEVGAVGNALG
jgi:glycosyltransferase involved in cell wall biosynthesis